MFQFNIPYNFHDQKNDVDVMLRIPRKKQDNTKDKLSWGKSGGGGLAEKSTVKIISTL